VPNFADLFVEELRRKRSEILRVVSGAPELAARYRGLVERVWVRGIEGRRCFERVYAVDSSGDEIEVSGGGVVLVTRALALGAGGAELRRLRVDALFPRDLRDYEDFKRLAREHMEHLAALDAIEEGADLVLIDGSLFGRMSHVLRELRVDGREDFLLEYVETYGELLSKAARRGAVVVGVSKDSRSRVLREELLLTELRRLLASASPELRARVLELWGVLRRRPRQALEELRRLEREGLDPRVLELFAEARSPLPDAKLLMALVREPGYTLPLRLCLERVTMGVVDVALADEGRLLELMQSLFESTYDRLGPQFRERVGRVVRALRSYPPILVSYAILSRGDDPLRVDVVLGGGAAGGELGFVSEVPEGFARVLSHLAFLHAGERGYNVLLLEADRRVKTTAETMELYHRLAMRELGELIVHSRGDRRLYFP